MKAPLWPWQSNYYEYSRQTADTCFGPDKNTRINCSIQMIFAEICINLFLPDSMSDFLFGRGSLSAISNCRLMRFLFSLCSFVFVISLRVKYLSEASLFSHLYGAGSWVPSLWILPQFFRDDSKVFQGQQSDIVIPACPLPLGFPPSGCWHLSWLPSMWRNSSWVAELLTWPLQWGNDNGAVFVLILPLPD